MGLFSKRNEPKVLPPPEPLLVISESDLADAERIMNQWDASMGNSNAVWDCLEIIGRRGGYRGGQATLIEAARGRDPKEVLQRPWRWWNEAARAANSGGRDALVGRVFLFTHMFVTQLSHQMKPGNSLDTGLEKPADQHYKDIAALAVDSMSRLDPNFLIHNTATGNVDVSSAIRMASEVCGFAAPPPDWNPNPQTIPSRPGQLPPNIVEMMTVFGQYRFDPMGSSTDPSYIWNGICAPLLPAVKFDTAGFLHELAASVLPVGGWAVYGGSHLVKELLSGDLNDPSYHAMMEASLDFLREQGVPKLRLNDYESSFWNEHKGRTEPWIPARPLPENPTLTPLTVGQDRLIAQLEQDEASNTVYARLADDGTYQALIDARRSDEDPRRVRKEWKTAISHYDLYREVAETLQVPSHWADPELEPFFPYPPPKINWLPEHPK